MHYEVPNLTSGTLLFANKHHSTLRIHK